MFSAKVSQLSRAKIGPILPVTSFHLRYVDLLGHLSILLQGHKFIELSSSLGESVCDVPDPQYTCRSEGEDYVI